MSSVPPRRAPAPPASAHHQLHATNITGEYGTHNPSRPPIVNDNDDDSSLMMPPPSVRAHSEKTVIVDGRKRAKVADDNGTVMSDSRNWDVFRTVPEQEDSTRHSLWMIIALQLLKIGTIIVVTALVLFSAFVAKTSFLLMTSAIGWGGKNASICHEPRLEIPPAKNLTVGIEHRHVVKWIWSVYIAICFPEMCCFVKSLYRVCFRNVKQPTLAQFFTVFTIESLHAVGVGLLVFRLLPNLDAVTGAMLTSCLSFIPAVLTLLSRKPAKITVILVVFDIMAIGAQSSGFWAWPMFFPEVAKEALTVPIALTLISLGYWQNFVHEHSVFPFIRGLARLSKTLHEKRSKTYTLVAPWKCIVYLMTVFVLSTTRISFAQLMEPEPFGSKTILLYAWGKEPWTSAGNTGQWQGQNNGQWNPQQDRECTHTQVLIRCTENVPNGWPPKPITHPPDHTAATHSWMKDQAPTVNPEQAYEVEKNQLNRGSILNPLDVVAGQKRMKRDKVGSGPGFDVYEKETHAFDSLWLVILHCISVLVCYQCSKFACKVMVQPIGFTLPLAFMVPITMVTLIRFCALRAANPCFFARGMNLELFWHCYDHTSDYSTFMMSTQFWVWLTWFLSQFWVTIHLWRPKAERLASGDRLFVVPSFSAAFIDQSLVLNRRRDDTADVKTEDIDLSEEQGFYDALNKIPTAPSVLSASSTGKSQDMINRPNERADSIVKIYACTTMWHESGKEMTCMLKSIFRLDEDQCARRNAQKYLKVVDPDYYEMEAHIFMDDAFDINEYGEPVVNKFVHQLIEKMGVAATAIHQTQMRLKPPVKIATPYGGRLVYTLPGKNRLTVHLKDKTRIRHRKRWSQVMYLYYLLGYRIMQKVDDDNRKEVISENTFILTLDGDVDFKPSCVHLLVDLMKKNRKLGAACGRIHPRGTGLMVWYQKFEYAIGHWFQKATEHMIGCVMCAPGCFSLFRSCALMDDNVAKRYAQKSEQPKDYIQYDQGEDRWLCTLLLQRGYRVEYCAASDALTYAPEGFNEFFNQRRRWIPSTMANTMDLVSDYKNVVRVNDNISIWYILYQFVMLVSSILGPGTIFLMTIGAISISFDSDIYVSFLVCLTPVAIFAVICMTCSGDTQLIAAQVVAALFTLLMTAVIVGTALQIKKDGLYSPHAIFLFAVMGSFLIAAAMHPLEWSCIVPVVLYFLAIPCMYMILPIYSICNLNVVSWGTRENAKIDDPSNATGLNMHGMRNRRGTASETANEIDGSVSVGCGSACRFLCCLTPSAIGASPQMYRLNYQLAEIDKKIERIERKWTGPTSGVAGRGGRDYLDERGELLDGADDDDMEEDHEQEMNEERGGKMAQTVSETWLEHRQLKRATRNSLEPDEEQFWKELIDKYLHPMRLDKKEQQRIKSGLEDLRNKVAFVFFMMNGLFIMIVFLLQMKKDCLHVEWPLGPKVNRSFIPCDSMFTDETWEVTGLQLEPIGLVFLIFFMSILMIQFSAMLFHRLGTLAHIIASTELFCFRSKRTKPSEEELVVANAVEIARELQAIKGIDTNDEDPYEEENHISRRRVVQHLESSRRADGRHKTETLDAAFRKRFFALRADDAGAVSGDSTPVLGGKPLTARRSTRQAITKRRNSIFGTLDAEDKRQYESETRLDEDTERQHRAPAQRRLEQIFQPQHMQQQLATTDDESLRIPHPASHQRLPVRRGLGGGGGQPGWMGETGRPSRQQARDQFLLEAASQSSNSPPDSRL